jgi:hypothetical protein
MVLYEGRQTLCICKKLAERDVPWSVCRRIIPGRCNVHTQREEESTARAARTATEISALLRLAAQVPGPSMTTEACTANTSISAGVLSANRSRSSQAGRDDKCQEPERSNSGACSAPLVATGNEPQTGSRTSLSAPCSRRDARFWQISSTIGGYLRSPLPLPYLVNRDRGRG